jgi:hypothetical protein
MASADHGAPGRTVLSLEEPVSAALAEIEAVADEPLRDDEAPPPPHERDAPNPARAPANPARAALEPEARTAGPIAVVGEDLPATRGPARRAWTVTDLVVAIVALGVIGASLAGLVWVLR